MWRGSNDSYTVDAYQEIGDLYKWAYRKWFVEAGLLRHDVHELLSTLQCLHALQIR